MREVSRGLAAAVAALLAMAGVAAAGLALLGAGRFTPAVVALAVGAPVDVEAVPAAGLPVALHGDLHGIPLGVSLVGAVVLGLLLHRRDGELLVRGAVAAAAFSAGMAVIALLAKGNLALPEGTGGLRGCVSTGPRIPLPGRLDAGFSVAVGPAVLGAAILALAVVGVCWLMTRFPSVATGFRALRWPAAGLAVVCFVAAWAFGGAAAAGGVLLVLPQLVTGAVLLGLGVPWMVDPALPCVPAFGSFTPGLWVSGALLLVSVIVLVVRRGRPLRRAAAVSAVAGGVAVVMTLLSRVSAEVSVSAFGFSVPVLDVRLTANPLLALAAGALAGFAGSLVLSALSVSSPAWKR
ncbi:hypothetical protein Amsp01_061500 [Amycolatopsis sp. NBRC 101858]|uniref:hypothetical protein n=1 Tax=Amycolatopsis sp. NBRC 101858 TaxID=3032200 RepID=UPI0024A15617|nr:hypothetical protein [Amycolatopsis sp. NBRC 101858]GLY40127.1 hypothetical protein Amsp01_061500 [Amycolatopsis sp. NBRC 101858]